MHGPRYCIWVQNEFKRLQAVVRAFAESMSLTSTEAAAAWNQATFPPPPLPAVEDPEGVDPSDTSPPAVAGEAVALLHGNTTHSSNFNDDSSVGDNIDIPAYGHTCTTTSSSSNSGVVDVDTAAVGHASSSSSTTSSLRRRHHCCCEPQHHHQLSL